MSADITGSGVGRAIECPSAYALPAVGDAGGSRGRRRGTGVHRYLQLLSAGVPRDESLAQVPAEFREIAEWINPEQVPAGETEVAVAYDVVTGRARRIVAPDRQYDVGPTEIPATTDLVVRGELLEVHDWKTVSWDLDLELVWPQVEFNALCHARIEGRDEAVGGVGVIREDGSIDWYRRKLDWEDLARIAAGVRRAWDRVQAARAARAEHEARNAAPWTPDVVEGAHCRYCPALVHCPAKRGAISAANLYSATGPLSPEDAGRAFLVAQAAEDAAKRIRAAARDLADTHGALPTGDGRFVRRNGAGALCVLRSRGGGERAA